MLKLVRSSNFCVMILSEVVKFCAICKFNEFLFSKPAFKKTDECPVLKWSPCKLPNFKIKMAGNFSMPLDENKSQNLYSKEKITLQKTKKGNLSKKLKNHQV